MAQTLKRQRRRYTDREVLFLRAAPVPDLLTAAATLDPCPDVIYTVGPAPGAGELRALVGADPGPGWVAAGHYARIPAPVLRFRRDSGHILEIHRAASFFGDGNYGPSDASEAHNFLGGLVRAAFDEGRLLTTPASTGRYLLARCISGDREWPVLSDDTQELLRSTSGQGRIQMFGREGSGRLVQYDARLAYGALCGQLPAGEPTLDTIDRFDGWATPARYQVRFTVPKRWNRECVCGAPGHDGIGILPVRGIDRWDWPAHPGETGTGWVDGRELAVAQRHGWTFTILERLMFPGPPYPPATRPNSQPTNAGPLDLWAKRLGGLRRVDDHGTRAELVNAALRSILLFGIGALHGTPRRVTHSVTRAEAERGAIPADARDVMPLGDRFVWTEREPVRWPEMSHPEWTTAVWARARAALLTHPTAESGVRAGLLEIPATTAVGAFTDALYMTADPGWRDDGRPGRFRRVWADDRDGPLPRTALELRRRKAETL